MIPVSTWDSEKRSALASMANVAGLGVMGVGSMVFPVLVANVLTYEPANQIRWLICIPDPAEDPHPRRQAEMAERHGREHSYQ